MARGVASDGSRRMVVEPPSDQALHTAREVPAGKINVTDPDSRNLKTTSGCMQGYNAQAVVMRPARSCSRRRSAPTSLDTANLEPMIETACHELQAARGSTEQTGVVAGRRGLLEERRDRRAGSPGHPDARLPPMPTAAKSRDPADEVVFMTSPVGVVGDRLRQGALSQTPRHDRTRLRPDQRQPRRPTVSPRRGRSAVQITITPEEVLRHPKIVLTRAGQTQPLCATASARSASRRTVLQLRVALLR